MKRNYTIRHARATVSPLSPFGGGWRFATYDAERKAWHERQPRDYYTAAQARREALIETARAALELDPYDYDDRGGPWTDYVPA